jgi:hypothetical protein
VRSINTRTGRTLVGDYFGRNWLRR